eukprot:6408524-Amphidinium_carterae.1
MVVRQVELGENLCKLARCLIPLLCFKGVHCSRDCCVAGLRVDKERSGILPGRSAGDFDVHRGPLARPMAVDFAVCSGMAPSNMFASCKEGSSTLYYAGTYKNNYKVTAAS